MTVHSKRGTLNKELASTQLTDYLNLNNRLTKMYIYIQLRTLSLQVKSPEKKGWHL